MDGPKQRHGCLTAWLILMIVANSLSALMYLFARNLIMDAVPGAPGWTFPVYAALGTVNVVCAVALARWKKWGFYGFVLTTIAGLVMNILIQVEVRQIIFGLLGIVILFGVLHIGKENKGWPQLE